MVHAGFKGKEVKMKNLRNVTSLGMVALSSMVLLAAPAQASSRSCVPYGHQQQPHAAHYMPQQPHGYGQHLGWGKHDGGHFQQASIDGRQARQGERIHNGIHSGQLTPREAQKLAYEQRNIEHLQRHYTADGHLSPAEARHLDWQLDQARWNIRQEKHDYQYRY